MDEGAEVKATDSGLLFLRRLAGGESTKEMGDLLLLLTGRQQVPVSCNVPVGRDDDVVRCLIEATFKHS